MKRFVRTRVVVLLATLVLGAAFHFAHHVLDPHCESTAGAESHPCLTCTALHGAYDAPVVWNGAGPTTSPRPAELVGPAARESRDVIGAIASRAPPAV